MRAGRDNIKGDGERLGLGLRYGDDLPFPFLQSPTTASLFASFSSLPFLSVRSEVKILPH